MAQAVLMDHLEMKKGNLDRRKENENHQVRIALNHSQSKSESACLMIIQKYFYCLETDASFPTGSRIYFALEFLNWQITFI